MIRERDYRGIDPGRGADRSLTWRLRQPIVPLVKGAYRAFGWMTADLRCRPDYLIIGGKRTGSTTLARNLVAYDDVMTLVPHREDRKGIYYFDVHHDRGDRWYRSHFPIEQSRNALERRLGRRVVVGEASPWYLQHPHAPRRAAAYAPGLRVVAVLRDPVERAHSHYRERVKQGIETLETFEAGLDAEPERLRGEWQRMVDDSGYVSLAHLNHGYLAQSLYADALERWEAAVGVEHLLVLRSEDLFADSEAALGRVRRFLGLADVPARAADHFNRLPGSTLPDVVVERVRAATAADQLAVQRRFDHGV